MFSASPLGRIARIRPSSISTAVSGRTLGSTQSIRFACERIVFMTALPERLRAGAGRDDRLRQGRLDLHVLIALAGKPQRVIAEADWRVLGRAVDRAAGRQAFDDRVVIGVAEERDRVAHL